MTQSRMEWGVVSKLLQDYKGVVQLIISVYHDYGRSACRFVIKQLVRFPDPLADGSQAGALSIKQPDPSGCEPPMFS